MICSSLAGEAAAHPLPANTRKFKRSESVSNRLRHGKRYGILARIACRMMALQSALNSRFNTRICVMRTGETFSWRNPSRPDDDPAVTFSSCTALNVMGPSSWWGAANADAEIESRVLAAIDVSVNRFMSVSLLMAMRATHRYHCISPTENNKYKKSMITWWMPPFGCANWMNATACKARGSEGLRKILADMRVRPHRVERCAALPEIQLSGAARQSFRCIPRRYCCCRSG